MKVGPLIGFIFIRAEQVLGSMVLLTCVDVEASDALLLNPSSGLLWSDEKGSTLLSIEATPIPDDRSSFILFEGHEFEGRPSSSLQTGAVTPEMVGPFLIGRVMSTDPVAATAVIVRRFSSVITVGNVAIHVGVCAAFDDLLAIFLLGRWGHFGFSSLFSR